MNYFEVEIAKYERRLQRIDRNPSPSMLASNKLLYEAFLDHNRQLLKWWQDGRPFVSPSGTGMGMMTRVFGDFRPLGLVPMADRLGSKDAEASFAKVQGMGFPDWICDRAVLLLPMAMEGVAMPKPSLILTRTGSCNVINNTHHALADIMDLPIYVVEVPFSDPYTEHLGYVTRQLEGLIKFVEANCPDAKYDEGALVELQRLDRRWFAALHDIYRLRQNTPCPDHPRDVFREPIQPPDIVNSSTIVKYYESYRDELQERVNRCFSPVGEEKLRIVWAISGPFGSNVWDYLADRGVVVPHWQYGGVERNFIKPIYGDATEFGRKLTPIEEVARILLYNCWGGVGERWVRDTVSACKVFKADGLVMYEQTGCQPVLGLGHFVQQRLEKELSVPSWCIEGRMLVGHTPRTEAEFMSGLEQFIDLCFQRKKEKTRGTS